MKAATHPVPGCLLAILAAGTLVSCSTSSTGQAPAGVAVVSAHWVKVQQDPPTFFPKGVPADHPTGFSDGTWIATGDEVGTRYFIPARGANTKALIAEALSTVTPERRKQLKRDGPDVDMKGATGKVLKSGANGLGELFLFMKREQARIR